MPQNGTDGKELTKRQVQVIASIVNSPTILDAARKVRTSRSTIYRWLGKDAFRQELRRQRKIIADAALDTIQYHIEQAVNTLAGLLGSDSDAVRRRAARDILEMALRVKEHHDFDDRIKSIEQQLELPL
jgi:hypothetical protein